MTAILIKDYSNWIVKDAATHCEGLGVSLNLTNGTKPAADQAIIERNDASSTPGSEVVAGGYVNVVIFPLEPRQS